MYRTRAIAAGNDEIELRLVDKLQSARLKTTSEPLTVAIDMSAPSVFTPRLMLPLERAGATALGALAHAIPRRNYRANGKIRVMLLVNSLVPYGAENFVLNHARHADRSRFDLTVCQLGGLETLAESVRATGSELLSARGRFRFDPLAMRRLADWLRKRRIDVLQTHTGYAGIVGRLIGRAVGVPAVVSTEQSLHHDNASWQLYANDLTFTLADSNVYISQAVATSYAALFPDLVRTSPIVISNGVDARHIAALAERSRAEVRAEIGIGPHELAFANVGRLVALKGQRFAIQALARIKREVPHASLWIVGGGPLEAELRETAKQAGVAGDVHLLGERLDVHRLLGAFDAYLHPSTTEALGIAVLEAMSAGLPTLASTVGGIPELIRHGETGWLFQSRSVDEIAQLMLNVARNQAHSRAVGKAGQDFIFREHDIRASVAAYERTYLTLLEGVAPSSN